MKKWLILALLMSSPTFAGEVLLSWTAPTQNEDGTTLTDLDGYFIYYGTTPGGPYPIVVELTDETLTSTVITGLVADTYYFVATAYNIPGVESQYSNEATKIVGTKPNPPILQ